jgi:hypothetical protein
MIQSPKALGLFLCDQAHFEHETLKPSLIGIFDGIAVDAFPSPPQRFDVFAALTDGLGDATLHLVATHLETDRQVYAHSMEYAFVNPLRVVNLRIKVRACSFPDPGTYAFALWADEEVIAQTRIRVRLLEG